MPEELSRELIERLARLRSRREWQRVRTGFFRALSVLVLLAVSALAAEAVLHLSITGRTILFWSTIGLMASAVILLFLPAVFEKTGIRPRLTNEDLAERIGEHFTEVEDKLINVLQLNYAFAAQPVGSGAFAQAAFATTYGSVRHLDFNAILDNRPVRRSMVFFVIALILGGGSFFASGGELMAAGERLANYDTFYQKPAPFQLVVEPGNGKLLRGSTVKFTVRTNGEQLKNLTLNFREEGAKEFDKIELRATPIGKTNKTQFVYELRVQRPLEYFAEAREIVSDKFTIAVLDKPLVRSLSVVVAPPWYTREVPRSLDENLGDVTGIVGTRIQLSAQSSKPLLAARLVFTPYVGADPNMPQAKAQVYNLNVNGALANGAVQFRQSGLYHIELLDTDSLWSEKPIEYTVTLSEDEMPAVALLDPGERADLPGNLRLPMLVRIHDDFGFSKLRLGYRITKSKFVPEEKEYQWLDLPLADYHTQDLEVPYIWNLAKLDITPEDELGYVLELADNDMISGPKKVRTSEFAVRFPSVDEIFQKAEEEHAQTERSLQEIKQDADDLKKKIDETVSEMRQQANSDVGKKQQEFSVRKDAEDIMKRQSELENRVSEVKNKLDQMTKNLDQQNAISEQTLQKYAELQKLLEEVKTPELEAAFDKLKQAMKNMDQRAMEQAMKEVQFNEDQFKASIERTANLLKKIKLEQKLDELMKRSDELAKNQEQTAKDQQSAAENSKQSPQDKAAAEQKQKDAMNELARMQEEAQQMAKDMQKLPEQMQAPEEMKDAAEAVNDPSLEQAMEDAQEAMKQSQNQRASQRSKDAAQKLKKARNKLEDLKQKMAESEKQRNMAEMKRMRDEMNRLSKEEEKLKQKSKEAMPNSNVFRDFAREQAERKEELGQLASEMMQLAQKTPSVTPQMGREMGKAFNNMQQAQESMTERDQQNSVSNAQGAMAALNRASQETQKAMDAMQQQGGNGSCPNPGGQNPSGEGEPNQPGGGSAMQQFLNQINNFAERQQQLNQQMQQMLNGQGQGGERQMLEQQASAARMQAGQQALQKSIEELAKEQQQAGQGKKKAVDELKKIAEEMQDLVSNMRTQGVKQETIQRQERILSRLLEAQRSVNERDKEETREATSGENMTRVSPSDVNLTPEERRNLLREEALRARDAGYTRDYQQLIRKYLEQLEK